jgi:hypothetical protein
MADTTHDPRPDEALGGHTEPDDPVTADSDDPVTTDPDDPTAATDAEAGEADDPTDAEEAETAETVGDDPSDVEAAAAPTEAGEPDDPVDVEDVDDVGETDAIVPEVPEIPGAAAEPDDPWTGAGEADDRADPARADVEEAEAADEAAGDDPAVAQEPPAAPAEPDVASPEYDTAVPADVAPVGAVEPADEPEPVAATATAFAEDDTAAPDRGHDWVDRWTEIQVGFVDDPRQTIEAADALVGEVLDEVMATFTTERARLEGQWRSGSEPSTEDLRLALQRYRSFFDRLVAT